MTVIHQCSACGYEGRVVETAETYLCELCYDKYVQERQREMRCPCCGSMGITDMGICYACENAPGPYENGFYDAYSGSHAPCPHDSTTPEAEQWKAGQLAGLAAVEHESKEQANA
jgi:hypothetical protein